MICVTIGRGRHRQLIAEYKHLSETGCQLVELRLDFILTPVNLRRILLEKQCPMLITVRRQRDGGSWVRGEEERLLLLRQAIAAGVDYVDLEEDIAASIPRFGKTKRVISYHNFRETPENLPALHAKMATLDPDIVKIATMAHSPHDCMKMFRLMRYSRIPTIAIGMGEMGAPTRILGGKFGAPFTYATFHAERVLAPGQLSFQQMKDVYHYDQINVDTKVFGVIADPVAQSLSPLIHNTAFVQQQKNCVYVPFRVPREELGQFINDCWELGVQGLSVTIPHKEEILQHVEKIDAPSQQIGAANTVVWQGERRFGFNTDYRAAMNSIDKVFGASDESGGALAGKTALMLGAGGVAKAIVHGLVRRQANVYISSRTSFRDDDLALQFNARSIPWNQRHTVAPDLIVNGTPVGMHPHLDETPFPANDLRRGMVVFDTVYNPEQTLLIKQAREAGCETITGVDMFVEQAAAQYRHFTGDEPPVEVMRQVIRRAISPAKL